VGVQPPSGEDDNLRVTRDFSLDTHWFHGAQFSCGYPSFFEARHAENCRSVAFCVSQTLGCVGGTIEGFAQSSPYVVDGLPLGGRVRFESEAYKSYDCGPSEKFAGFTWCHREQTEKTNRGEVLVANSMQFI
jgi:hypothetical protein